MPDTWTATDGLGRTLPTYAETGGVRYASLAEALRTAGRGGTVTLLTNATAPASLVAGRTIVNNGYLLVTYNDFHATVIMLH